MSDDEFTQYIQPFKNSLTAEQQQVEIDRLLRGDPPARVTTDEEEQRIRSLSSGAERLAALEKVEQLRLARLIEERGK